MPVHVVVIGNGVSGVTAAIRLREKQPEWRITIISGESGYHYSRPALMYIFMGHLNYKATKPFEDFFWRQKQLHLVRDWIVKIDLKKRRLILYRGEPLDFDFLLIATGSKPNRFGWPGQDLDGVQSLYNLQDLRLLSANVKYTRQAVIVGGGLIGIELAEMLNFCNIQVIFLVQESSYWNNVIPRDESEMINQVIRQHGISLKMETQLQEILADKNGRVCSVLTDKGERIGCQLVGLTAGVSPNIDLVSNSPIETNRGVLVNRHLETNFSGIFAAGDCAEIRNLDGPANLIQQAWYTGKMQGEVVGDVIAGEDRTYDPGIWYNSSKFFDLEYQVYGRVNMNVSGEKNLFWEHPNRRHSVRIVYTDNGVIGLNFMGLRYRQKICERWILEQRSPDYVIQHLKEGNFDPEFFRRNELNIIRAFKEQIVS